MVASDPTLPGQGRSVAELESLLAMRDQRVAELEDAVERTEGLCEVLDDGGGWSSSLQTRASWLLGLLVCQSCSSFILADNTELLQAHPTVSHVGFERPGPQPPSLPTVSFGRSPPPPPRPTMSLERPRPPPQPRPTAH